MNRFNDGMYWGKGDRRPYPMRIPGLELWNSAQRSKMYQASAGTTIANAATDPIGYFADVSGKKRHFLQATGADRPLLSEVGGGLVPDYDGVSDLMTLAHDNVFHTPPFTVVARFRLDVLPSTLGLEEYLLNKKDSVSAFAWILRAASGGDTIRFEYKDAGAVVKTIIGGTLVADTWYTAIGTIDSSFDAELFLDATTQGTTTAASLLVSDDELSVGASLSGANELDGQISDTLFYSKVLNANEIADVTEYLSQPFTPLVYDPLVYVSSSRSAKWQEDGRTTPADEAGETVGAWDDVSGNGRHFLQATAANRPLLLADDNGVLDPDFDGTNDVLALAGEAALRTPPFTIFGKFRLDEIASVSGSDQYISIFRDTVFQDSAWFFRQALATDKLTFAANDTDSSLVQLNSISALSTGIWYAVIATIDASFNMELFLDGASQDTGALAKTLFPSDDNLYLGAVSATGSDPMDGQKSNFGFIPRVLTSTEIATLNAHL